MLLIYCPHCQEHREEEEFSYGGEAHITRPFAPESLTDAEWGDYLFFRKNPRGLHHEMWYHGVGFAYPDANVNVHDNVNVYVTDNV